MFFCFLHASIQSVANVWPLGVDRTLLLILMVFKLMVCLELPLQVLRTLTRSRY